MESKPLYQVGSKVKYHKTRVSNGLQFSDYDIGTILSIHINHLGVGYEIDTWQRGVFLIESRVICSISRLDAFIDILEKNKSILMDLAIVDSRDGAIKFKVNNSEQIEQILHYLTLYFTEAIDYQIIISHTTEMLPGTLAIVFTDSKNYVTRYVNKEERETHTFIGLDVANEGDKTVIFKQTKDGGSVEVVEHPYCTTVEDLLDLNVVYPKGADRGLLQSEHLKFLMLPQFKDMKDKALTLTIIKHMCKEQLDEYRKLKPHSPVTYD